MNAREIQVLRTLDKADKLGLEETIILLQKPLEEFGAGLDKCSALLIGDFIQCRGKNNDETIHNMRKWFDSSKRFSYRLKLLGILDQIEDGEKTLLDKLLDIPINEDNTWNNGGRPDNIAWMLDDILLKILTISNIQKEIT